MMNDIDPGMIRKSRRKVLTHLIGFFVLLILTFAAMLVLSEGPWIAHPENASRIVLLEMMCETVITLTVFMFLWTCGGWSRFLLWLEALGQSLLLLLPIWGFFTDREYLLLLFVWFLILAMKAYAFFLLASWFSENPFARFFYISRKLNLHSAGKQVERPRKQTRQAEEVRLEQRKPAEKKKEPVEKTRTVVRMKERRQLNEGQIAVRLGLMAYGELIVFPVIIQVFSEFFVSLDNRYIFASEWMFTDCLISAIIWTWPIFFLFLEMRSARKLTLAAVFAQIMSTLFFMWRLWEIYNGLTEYPPMTYVYLIALDFIRLALLFWAAYPIFTLPKARSRRKPLDQVIFGDDEVFYEDEFDEEDEDSAEYENEA